MHSMKRNLLLVLFFILSINLCWSKEGRIVVLTTFQSEEGKSFFNSDDYSVYKRIEGYFAKYSKSTFEKLVFIHKASFIQITRELNNPENIGIFFIGHGGFGNDQTSAIQNTGIFDGNDAQIQSVFTSIQKKLKFLALISCNSKGIMEKTMIAAKTSFSADLNVKLFDGKIDVRQGIRESLAQYEPLMKDLTLDESSEIQDPQRFVSLKLSRKNRTSSVPTLVTINNRMVGVFNGKDLDQSIEVKISYEELLLSKKLSLVHDSGQGQQVKLDLGDLEIESGCRLTPELNRNGKLLGVSKNYFKMDCSDVFTTPVDWQGSVLEFNSRT
jgi:hypothetical protein